MTKPELFEAIVVGAGPAGLAAALYLACYRRSVLVLHDGRRRARRIPKTYNVPGYAKGISGAALIRRMSANAVEYGVLMGKARIGTAGRSGGAFVLSSDDGANWSSRTLIRATGVRLNQVDLPCRVHEAAIGVGILRYCPACDGYEHTGNTPRTHREHTGKRIGVVGRDSNDAAEAMFLRQYSRDSTLMPLSHPERGEEQLAAGSRPTQPSGAGVTAAAQ